MKTFLSVPELAATASHIENVQRTIDRLSRVKVEAWEQMLHVAARMYQAGQLGAKDLDAMLIDMRDSYGSSFTKVWDRVMPVPAKKVRHLAERELHNRPNGPLGSWNGTFPIGHQPAPLRGQAVVYVLFDDTNEPVYVGSTDNFRERMAEHRKEKPGLTAWVAYPCRDREHAYDLEVELLGQHRPRLNKKVGR